VIARRTKIQLIAFAMLAVVGMAFLGFKYVGLDRVILGGGYDVSADFSDSGGIFVNAEVTYRGIAVGRVSDMKLIDNGVRVVLRIDPNAAKIPAETKAVVANRSAVGEQYVDLRPDVDKGPYLTAGSVIPVTRTAIPIPVEQLLLDTDTLARSLNTDNLRTVVDELGKAFAGSGNDLGRLIDNGNLLLARAEQSVPQTQKLITDGETVLTTQVNNRSAIQQWAADLHQVTDTLVQIDPDLRGLVVNAPDAGAALQQLVDNAGPGLGSLVRNLDILNGVTIPRLQGVQQLLATYPDVVSGGYSVIRDDGGQMRAHFGFVLNNGDPRACTTGYVSTGQTPTPASVAALNTNQVQCQVYNGVDPNPGDGVNESGSDIRGSQNIGGSGGTGSGGSQSGLAGSSGNLPSTTVLDQVLGSVLSANPFSRTLG
jgi:phospholipid/cholesterol/gamma-HCH transport system substrate-binding protein